MMVALRFLAELVAAGWGFVAAASLRAALLLALVAALALVAGRWLPARGRQLLWGLALIGGLALPALSALLPGWPVATPVPATVEHWLGALRPAVTSTGPRLAAERVAAATTPPPPAAPLPASVIASTSAAATATAATPGQPLPAAPGVASTAARTSGAVRIVPLAVLALWVLGLGLALARLGVSHARAWRLARRARALTSPDWTDELARAAARLGVRRPVRLLVSGEVSTPMTAGLWRPLVLLPPAACGWSGPRRAVVLLHELVHVRRGDWAVQALAALACAVYWFNPLAWYGARRLAREQELACDEKVMALGERPSSYAAHLLAIARAAAGTTHSPALPVLQMTRGSQIEERIMSILNPHRERRRPSFVAPVLLVAAGLVPALAAVQPVPFSTAAAAPPATATAVDTRPLARTLSEITDLEARLAPFEDQMEAVEQGMESLENEMAAVEREMAPVEAELDSLDDEMDVYEARLATIEGELEPHEAALAGIDAEMEPVEARLAAVEADLEPFEARLAAVETELEPLESRLEELDGQLAPIGDEMERLDGELGEEGEGGAGASARMAELAARMRPIQEQMAGVMRQMEPIHARLASIHAEMEPVLARMAEEQRRLEPFHERMAAVQAGMEPVLARMAAVQAEMAPIHEKMAASHQQRMAPVQARMAEIQERMAPFQARMGEIQRQMEPLQREIETRQRRLEQELEALVEAILRDELADAVGDGAPYAATARRIVESVSVRIYDERLHLLSSPGELRRLLEVAFPAPRSGVAPQELAAARERAAEAIARLEVPTGR